MQTIMKAGLALGFATAMATGTIAPASAQGFYFNAPGVHIGVGEPGYYHRHYWGHPRYYDYYDGPPVEGGYSDNGCPPHYTIQGGVCKPYRGY